MAQNDDAVFTAAKGYIFTAVAGLQAPTPADVAAFDPATGITSLDSDGVTPVPWVSLGHTSREDLPEFGFDGGDSEVKGTWQNASFKQVVSEAPVDYVTFHLHQFDEAGLELYYGTTNGTATAGVFQVNDAPVNSIEKALLIVMVDGTAKIGFHATKVGVKREDAIALAVDEFSVLPLRATFLKHNEAPMFAWISSQIV